MALYAFVLVAVLFTVNANNYFNVINHCPYDVWVGLLNNPGKFLPRSGGFKLGHGQSSNVNMGTGWAGRLWGRTHCSGSGHCQTGDCGNKIACNGAGGVPPVTLAEFTLNGHASLDFYDVSLVDGYNLQMKVTPVGGTYDAGAGGGDYYCRQAGCYNDINGHCPGDLQVHGTGGVIACKSACLRYNSDQYCCRGAHGTPGTCPPFYASEIFKQSCPKAYSYAYDDQTSTFTCKGSSMNHVQLGSNPNTLVNASCQYHLPSRKSSNSKNCLRTVRQDISSSGLPPIELKLFNKDMKT